MDRIKFLNLDTFKSDYERFTLPEYQYGRNYDDFLHKSYYLEIEDSRVECLVTDEESIDGIARSFVFLTVHYEDYDELYYNYAGYFIA